MNRAKTGIQHIHNSTQYIYMKMETVMKLAPHQQMHKYSTVPAKMKTEQAVSLIPEIQKESAKMETSVMQAA